MTNEQIKLLADDALNIACAYIQDNLGQDDGGNAAMYFSDDKVLNAFADYIRFELASMASE